MSWSPGAPAHRSPRVAISPRGADALLMVAVAAATVVALLVAVPVLHRQGVAISRSLLLIVVALAVAQCIPLLLWRIRPVLGFVLVEVCQLALVAMVPEAQIRGLPSMFLAFSLGSRIAPARATAMVTAAILAETITATVAAVVVQAPIAGNASGALLSAGSTLLLPMVAGIAVSSRTITARLLAEQAMHEQQRQVDDAVAEERRRIAGELHDVAHHLSGMVVQAAAIERMIDRDAAAAKTAAAQLRTQGKQTLNGLRSVVGLLRPDDDIATVAGLRDLPDLIASTQALGVDATLHSSGGEPDLAPIVDAAVYRIAQQAISNAIQHAPGSSVRVELATVPEELTMVIINGPARQSEVHGDGHGGTGLVVMRERAAHIGGTLTAGATDAGGWRVALTLPVAPMVPGTGGNR